MICAFQLSLDPIIPSATPGLLSEEDADYNPTPNSDSVTFTNGNPIQCTTLDIFPDDTDEPNELFLVQAIPVGGQILIPDDTSNVIIIDADCMLTT